MIDMQSLKQDKVLQLWQIYKTTANVSIDKSASIWAKETGRKYTQIKRHEKRDQQREAERSDYSGIKSAMLL